MIQTLCPNCQSFDAEFETVEEMIFGSTNWSADYTTHEECTECGWVLK